MYSVLILTGKAGSNKRLAEFSSEHFADDYFQLYAGKNDTHWVQLMGPDGTMKVWRKRK